MWAKGTLVGLVGCLALGAIAGAVWTLLAWGFKAGAAGALMLLLWGADPPREPSMRVLLNCTAKYAGCMRTETRGEACCGD